MFIYKGVGVNLMYKLKLISIAALSLIAVVMVFGVISMRADISDTEDAIAEIDHQIIEQKLRNEEYEDILADANTDDFFRDVAENDLGYASRDEKIYIDISGH